MEKIFLRLRKIWFFSELITGSSIALLQKPSIFKSAHKSVCMHACIIVKKHAFKMSVQMWPAEGALRLFFDECFDGGQKCV